MGLFSWMKSSVPFVVMVLVVTSIATNLIISKIAMSNGTSFFILSVYSNALATLLLSPCAFIFRRSELPPPPSQFCAGFSCLLHLDIHSIVNEDCFISSSKVQTSILKIYPSETIVVAFYCLFVTTQSTVVAVIAEKDSTAWKLEAEMGLVAVLYAGIMNLTCRLYLMAWCLSRRGPLFVTLFFPLTIVISVAIGVIFCNEALYFGSVIGAVVLVVGFYAVSWGKAKEGKVKMETQVSHGESTSHEVPLLQDAAQGA